MKMMKPHARDIDAAGELLQVLSAIDGRFGGPWPTKGPRDLNEALEDEDFDCDNEHHLQALYNHLAKLLRCAPNFYGRVIGGMCYVICWDYNRILDPGQNVIDLHPDIRAGLALLEQHRSDFLPNLERKARAAVAETIERSASRHLQEMRNASVSTLACKEPDDEGLAPTYTDELELRYVEACEERDHLRAVLKAAAITQPLVNALDDARSVISSINSGRSHEIRINGETCYWQREEWVRWALDDVLPRIEAVRSQ
jgi:hypothetical protein